MLTNLPDAYKIVRSRDAVIDIAKRYGILPEQLPGFLKQHALGGMYDPAKFDDYILAITGEEPCEVCGSPMASYKGLDRKTVSVCAFRKIHTAIANHIGVVKSTRPELTDEGAMLVMLGSVCPHNLFLADCIECGQKERQKRVMALREKRPPYG